MVDLFAKIIDVLFLALVGAGAVAGISVFLGIVIAVLLSDDWRDGDDS